MSFVTFLIPSLGRPYLKDTVCSLLEQTDNDWEAIILFDGVYVNIEEYNPTYDKRIYSIYYKKLGFPGKMRNLMFPFVNSKWVGFVDDDNTIKNTYVEKLKVHDTGEFDIIHFTMLYTWSGELIPNPKIETLQYGQFGMSFSIKKAFIDNKNVRFSENTGNEDFDFLTKSKELGAKIKITHDTQYVVPKISAWQF